MDNVNPSPWMFVRSPAGKVCQVGVCNGVARLRCGSGLKASHVPATGMSPTCDDCRRMIRAVTWHVANVGKPEETIKTPA